MKKYPFCRTVLGDYYLWGEYNEKPVYQHYRNTNFRQILTWTKWMHLTLFWLGNFLFNIPSKQKLELKSSKTRLLPSRSGVLIEFQSGVFTDNSRAISGLNSSFHQVDIWVISGWYLGNIWMMLGWYLGDMWVVKTGI